ncbi:reverse transcriptase domain-containing protein [Tanacetum coccineum]
MEKGPNHNGLHHQVAEDIERIYLKEAISKHGVPVLIISDKDSRFASRFWSSLYRALGTRLDMSIAYHPQLDGQ